MNDEQLIQLVRETPPEELSYEEMELLRHRISQSPEVREAVADHLQLEQYLGDHLGRVQVSVENILKTAGTLTPTAATSLSRLLGWSVASVAVISLVTVGVMSLRHRDDDQGVQARLPQDLAAKQALEKALEHDDGTSPSDKLPPWQAGTDIKGPHKPGDNLVAAGPENGTADIKDIPLPEIASGPPRPFTDVCFEEFSPDQLSAGMADLDRWFDNVQNKKRPKHTRERRDWGMVLDGVFRMRPKWPTDAALRLLLTDHNNLLIHVWCGQQGVALQYADFPTPSWAAYTTTRQGQDPLPATFTLVGTEDDRFRHTVVGNGGAHTVELRLQDGRLVLNRGDVLLLNVPLPGEAPQVVFDGKVLVRGIALVPSQKFPLEPATPAKDVQPSNLGSQDWKTESPPKSQFTKLPDGRVELSAEKVATPAWAALTITDPGLSEVIFEVEDPTPGSGIYLGDSSGKPLYQLGFFQEAKIKMPTFGFLRPGDLRTESQHVPEREIVPLAGSRMWFKFVQGPATIKCWTSPDGVHWGRALEPLRGSEVGFATAGIYCLPEVAGRFAVTGKRSIKLRRLESKKLIALESLAPESLRTRGLSLPKLTDPGAWLAQVMEAQPADANPGEWRAACALRTLAAMPTSSLCRTLLSGLIEEALARPISADARLKILAEAAILSDTWESADRFGKYYEQLARNLVREGHSRPFSLIRRGEMQASLWSRAAFTAITDEPIRAELLYLVSTNAWSEARELCRQLRFFTAKYPLDRKWSPDLDATGKLIFWADSLARRNLPAEPGASAMAIPSTWRHPLIEQLGKEGFNILAEFDAALAGEAYRDACQIISSASAQEALGLLPNAKDSRLLVSLPGAVALAMREHPALRRTMRDEFGPLADLRLKQAMANGDIHTVQAVTTQFFGTAAATQAHIWLGDRALSSGDFAQATGEYETALRDALPADRATLAARLRLAAAMLGRDVGEPPTTSIELSDTRLSPAEFERLVSDMRQRATVGQSGERVAVAGQSAGAAPLPARFTSKNWGRYDPSWGANPNNVPYPDLDWAGQQVSVTVAPPLMIVNNRVELAAYDLASGERKWKAAADSPGAQAHQLPLVPMKPLVVDKRTFVRQLTKNGPELVAYDIETGNDNKTGKPLWRSRPGDQVVSDPLWIEDELFVLTVTSQHQDLLQLYLTSYDRKTGAQLAQRPLIQFRDVWGKQIPCQAVAAGDSIVVIVGGAALCCDLLGQPRWLRRETWLTSAVDSRTLARHRDPPLVVGDVVYVTQPGMPGVECLDVATGQLRWQYVSPKLTRLVGLVKETSTKEKSDEKSAPERLVVQTSEGLVALDSKTGVPLWYHDADAMLEAQLCGGAGGVLYLQREKITDKLSRPKLVWLDPATGRVTGSSVLEDWKGERPGCGPMVTYEGRLWAFCSADDRKPNRDIVELTAAGPALPIDTQDKILAAWTVQFLPALRDAVSLVAPGWSLLASEQDQQTRLHDELRGDREVLVTLAHPDRPVRLARQVSVPKQGATRLRLRAGLQDGENWKLALRVGSKSLLAETVEPGSTSNGWKDWEVDLSPFAGQTVWLVLEQQVGGTRVAHAAWKRLEMVYPGK
jgi:outer membrane protein assembly factor BamB